MPCKPNGFTKFSIGPTGNGTAGIAGKRSRPGAKKKRPRRSVLAQLRARVLRFGDLRQHSATDFYAVE